MEALRGSQQPDVLPRRLCFFEGSDIPQSQPNYPCVCACAHTHRWMWTWACQYAQGPFVLIPMLSLLIEEGMLEKCFRRCSSCDGLSISPLAPQYVSHRVPRFILDGDRGRAAGNYLPTRTHTPPPSQNPLQIKRPASQLVRVTTQALKMKETAKVGRANTRQRKRTNRTARLSYVTLFGCQNQQTEKSSQEVTPLSSHARSFRQEASPACFEHAVLFTVTTTDGPEMSTADRSPQRTGQPIPCV